jgi:DNA-binding NarL/FixJ family response regulator
MNKISLIDEDNNLLDRITDFIVGDNSFYVVSKHNDLLSFLKKPPAGVDIIITQLLPVYDIQNNPYHSLKEKFSTAKILVVTPLEYANRSFETLKMGADGFCLKSDTLNELKSGLHSLISTGNYVSNSVLPYIINSIRAKSIFERENVLTPKENQIVKEVCEGHSYKVIAYNTNLSIDGVRYHLQRIYRKLEINSKTELVAIALS